MSLSENPNKCIQPEFSLVDFFQIIGTLAIRQGSNNDDLPTGQLVLFCEKNLNASIFIIYRHIIYHSIANWMYFQNIEVSDPLGQPCSRKNQKKSKKSPFFAKDKCAPLKSPEEITIFLRIWHFYETPILLGQFPVSQWWNESISIHVIHHQKVSVKVIRENGDFAKVRKKCRFVKKWRDNGYFWAFKSLLNLKMDIIVNVCPSGVPKIQISNPKSIHIENGTLFFIHGHFAMPTCEKNKGSRKRN